MHEICFVLCKFSSVLFVFLRVHARGIFGIAIARGMMMFAGLIGMLPQTLWVGRDMLEANVSYQDRR